MSASIHKVNGIWFPESIATAQGITWGAGTTRPFGLNSGQIVQGLVQSKSYAITSSVASGITGDRVEPTFPNTNLQDSAAFWYTSFQSFTDNSITGPGQVTISLGIGGAVLSGGLFYPIVQFQLDDGTGNVAGTILAGTMIGNASFFGALAPLYTDDAISSASLVAIQNDAF